MTTLIVTLMRGGEPMALGVSEALPLATFLHAKDPADITSKHLSKCVTFILVDSVINTGNLEGTIRVVVMTGVIRSQPLSTGRISQEFSRFQGLSFISLRLSDNHFTGHGATDTGNRLFNTVHLDLITGHGCD
ncbi:uncharacterized protein N7484_007902 [Penicillium longicatenatum]|uniref:uncharacterized protein n=1 Tax=Penicillium longicatenatum TaxID=1561947 RepID=UPI002547385B|nr:uncharacterized protein N7484_007902 [Penicillium longicatenatum]KAJ5640040.1 hypothetical protein N7484_007902 [Penicillium longicatenatum]